MKIYSYKLKTIFICMGLFVFLTGNQQVFSQQKKYLDFKDIIAALTFTTRINKSIKEINKQLVIDVRERRVNFILTSEKEKSLKKAGTSDLLIKVIRGELPEKLKEKIALYKSFTDNYNGDIKQKKIAIEAAKNFVEKYRNSAEDKQIIDYFEQSIPYLERQVITDKER